MSTFEKKRFLNLKPQLLAAPWNFADLDELVEQGRSLGLLDRNEERQIFRLDLEHRVLKETDPVRKKKLEAALSVYQALDGETSMKTAIDKLEKSARLHDWKLVDGNASST